MSLEVNPTVGGDMFGTLIESKARRQRRAGGTLLSILLHGTIIAGAIVVTRRVSVAKPTEPTPTPIVYSDLPKPMPHNLQRGPAEPARTYVPPGTIVVIPPSVMPHVLPPITSGPVIDDPAKLFIGGGLTTHDSSQATAGSAADPGAIYLGDDVEKRAELRSTVRPVYPEVLRSAGIGGHVIVRFVVDTLGRVEHESVVVREASHARFENAVRDVLPRLRFAPAEVNGHPVRMLVEMPFEFAISK
jgi:periplasmic protein TonB